MCRDEWRVWDPVEDKVLASMMYLAYTWPLAAALGNNHPLLGFIEEQRKHQQELLLEADKVQKPSHRDGDDSQDSDSDPVGDSKSSDAEVRCARCNKNITQVCPLS